MLCCRDMCRSESWHFEHRSLCLRWSHMLSHETGVFSHPSPARLLWPFTSWWSSGAQLLREFAVYSPSALIFPLLTYPLFILFVYLNQNAFFNTVRDNECIVANFDAFLHSQTSFKSSIIMNSINIHSMPIRCCQTVFRICIYVFIVLEFI